ncbi:hypothetical protein [Candidatus Neptunochlamydia vexilliferae]|nr:hypothetical protein [Candidatus Neptunochlamydia vexilliferae]
MKKKLFTPLVAAMMTLPLVGEEEATKTEPIQAEEIAAPAQKLLDEVLSDYRAGHYNSFLKKMDNNYTTANKKWEYNGLLEERKTLSSMVNEYQSEKSDAYKKEVATLYEAQNRELVAICLSHPNEKISREVRDMVFFTPTPHEQESIDFIHNLGHKFKGDGKTPLENQLIRIDIEFWLKGLSLGIAHSQNKMNHDAYQKKYLVLQIEKVKQMQQACEEGDLVDEKTKDYVNTAIEVLPKVHASATTRKYLTALGRGKIAPQNDLEKQLQVVMVKYLEKEETLSTKHFGK